MCRAWGHSADLGHVEFEAGLVTAKIIADQLVLPALQEVVSVFSGATGAEVIHDSRCFAELSRGIGPDIGMVSFP